MKTFSQLIFIALFGVTLVACDKSKEITSPNEEETISPKEKALREVVTPYVDHTVIATYSAMASEGLVLLDKVEAIEEAVATNNDYTDLMKQAGDAWRAMRHYWEQSEAFLFGPTDAHFIDPHIDSWPLDYNAMQALLSNAAQMAMIEEQGGKYVGNNLGYALKGFHAAEYFLFEEGKYHQTNLTHAEAVYLVGIVENLVQQAILLEDCWAGWVSAEKEALITDEEGGSMSFKENYGDYFINLTHPSWKSYQAVAEQIVSGCADIADEVANLKLGKPYRSSSKNDQEYIESPYSYTSTIDFADNIISIRNAYAGAQAGDASVADYVQSQDADLNQEVLDAIEQSISLIEQIQNFETHAKNDPTVKAAIDQVQILADLLNDEVQPLLSRL